MPSAAMATCREPLDVPESSADVVNGSVRAEVGEPSPLNASELRDRRQRRKLRLKKLDKKLEVLDRQIRKCAEAELSLDEMGSGYSAYLKEDLLKRKFVKTWQELCQLQRVNDSIVIEDEDSSCYRGTPYPEVNRRVQRLLRLNEFPDYIDIVQLLDRCNTKHNLGIAAEEKGQLARKVFKEVGRIMKRKRHRDFVHHFGSHLTDGFDSKVDPAEQDEGLLKQLQESMREGEKKMQAIVEDFVVKQEQEYDAQRSPEGDSCSVNEQEEEEEEEEEEEKGQDEKDKEELINVVDDGSDSDMGSEFHSVVGTAGESTGEGGGREEEEERGSLWLSTSSRLKVAPDSTVPTEPSEALVTTTQSRKRARSSDDKPGPSGLIFTPVTHISSSSEVVCLDDEEDMIIISDSDPG